MPTSKTKNSIYIQGKDGKLIFKENVSLSNIKKLIKKHNPSELQKFDNQ